VPSVFVPYLPPDDLAVLGCYTPLGWQPFFFGSVAYTRQHAGEARRALGTFWQGKLPVRYRGAAYTCV